MFLEGIQVLACPLLVFGLADRDASTDAQPWVEAKVDDVVLTELVTLFRILKPDYPLVDLKLLVADGARLSIQCAYVDSQVSNGLESCLLDVVYLNGQGWGAAPSLHKIISVGLRD